MFKNIFVFLFLLFAISLYSQDKSVSQEKHKITFLSLKDAIDLALQNHPELQKSKHSIEAAKGRHLRDISLPPMNLSLGYEFIPNGSAISEFDERTLEISQGFDFPTIYFAKGSKANVEINAANAEFEITTNFVKIAAKRAYYTTLTKYQLLKISEENYDIAGEFLKKAEVRYKVGESSNLELLTAKVQLAEAKSFIGTAKKEYQTSLNELNYSLGYNADIDFNNITFTDSLSYKPQNFSLDELISRSMTVNPGIKKAALELESSEISTRLAWMSLLPSFNVAYLSQANAIGSGFHGFSFGMSLPLWFMFDQKGQIQEADANNQYSNYELKNVKNNVIQKINAAYIDFINDEKQLKLYQNELIPQAEDIFRTAILSYQAGEITYLEFLQAKFTTINTRINSIKSMFDYEEAIINLEESTGLNLE